MTNSPFGFDAPEDSPGFLLWQTTMVWQRLIKKALEKHKISHAQFVLMAALLWWRGQDKDLTQVDLVKLSNLDKMTVSKSLRKLASLDLVQRHENQDDMRAKSVQLTRQGVALARQLVPLVEGVDANFFGQLNKEQEQALIGLLKCLSQTQDVASPQEEQS